MTKRYREAIEVDLADGVPIAFRWRDRAFRVATVLGHWREDAGWWAARGGVRVPQRDLWRVEARAAAAAGVYELLQEGGRWRLDRVWD